jgi:tRNA A-37 threonylcarbamoyl transferase component Bud32
MDADILELVRQERLAEAAELASTRGHAADACSLFERACDWSRAGAEALRAHEPRRALELALQARDSVLAERALAVAARDPRTLETLAPHLLARGHAAWAARAYEAAGRIVEAGAAWERAGDAVRAARAFESRGEDARAVRVLEAALRRKANGALLLTLGAILLRLGKDEPAVRALQRIARDAAERPAALRLLVPALARLGWTTASSEAAAELAGLPVPVRDARTEEAIEPSSDEGPAQPARSDGPRLLFGRYRWIADMASSPSARVFEAEAPASRERVVIKVFAVQSTGSLAQAAQSRFERDVRAIRGVDHPHLVPVRDILPQVPATVLAKMPAGSLEGLLAKGPLAPARAIEIACSVLSALAEAHRRGVLHGDVKPANVLFDAAGSARLGDFGTVHLADVSATATAGAFGSLGYRSPEEREGRPASTRSDVFAAGMLLHEMLTGVRPVALPGVSAALLPPSAAHPDLGAAHDGLLARLTAIAPDLRPADASAALDEIQRLSWPLRLRPLRPQERAASPRNGPRGPRLERLPAGSSFDTWTGRVVERIPLSDETLARARGFAAAAHPALQTVLRVDRPEATLWLLPAPVAPPPPVFSPSGAAPRRPSPNERACLGEAIAALHAAGIVHGAIDASHVVLGAGRDGDESDGASSVILRFAGSAAQEVTCADDLAALARLCAGP